jgi:hypothetical protein
MRIILCLLFGASTALSSPIIEFGADTLKFGHISVGGHHSRQLSVSNAGDEGLVVHDVAFQDEAFALVSPGLPDTISAGQQKWYQIDFGPAANQSYDGLFSFQSNDPVNPVALVHDQADGIPVFLPGEIIWSFQGIENVVSCTATDDIDGDGIQEVIAESFDAGAVGDNLLCISGSGLGQGSLLWSARPEGGPSNSGGYGDQCLITIDDMNRNGTQDIILGTAWGSRTVFAIEGTTGETIWSYDTHQNTPSGWIYSVISMGDMNGDSIPEVLAGAGSDANAAICLNGADGAKIWRRQVADAVYSVCRIDDYDYDGFPEAVLGAGDNDDLIYCTPGSGVDTTRHRWTYDTNGSSTLAVTTIMDVNLDSWKDVIAGTWYNGNRVIALAGYSSDNIGDTIWTNFAGGPVMKVVVCPDLNGDYFEDVLVSSWASYAQVLSGHDGAELWRYYMGDDVWAIHWAYDINEDDVNEVVAGSFTGSVTLINGIDGEAIWTCPTNQKIFTVRPIGDVNGDGKADIIAGQQLLNNVGGKIFLISGGTVEPDAVDDDLIVPRDHIIISNYPNPFNARTTISYSLPHDSRVKLEIFNLLGQRIQTLSDDYQKEGAHKVLWDASVDWISSGVYYCKLVAGEEVSSTKMTVLK